MSLLDAHDRPFVIFEPRLNFVEQLLNCELGGDESLEPLVGF